MGKPRSMDDLPEGANLTPPVPRHPTMPTPTPDDPTASGYYCGSRRTPGQVRQAAEQGRSAWPWCMNRAGKNTPHPGTGQCRNHGGMTANARKAALLRYAELHPAAVETFGRALVEEGVPWAVRVRAAAEIEDRAGFPRRVEVDVDAGRQLLLERLEQLRDETDDDGEDDTP